MSKKVVTTSFGLVLALSLVACDDRGTNQTPDPPAPPAVDETSFTVRIENLSGSSAIPTPFAAGAWAAHSADDVAFFDVDKADSGQGLEALAEDGAAVGLSGAVTAAVDRGATFDAIVPGGDLEFTITTTQKDSVLSFATMFVESNDVFLAPEPKGIPLFDENGDPLAERDVTSLLSLWDAGTEANQAPGFGVDQAPRQAAANTGGAEGVVRPFSDSTRAVPAAQSIASITVSETGGAFTITVSNDSADNKAISTPLAPMFFATHNTSFSLFTEDAAAIHAELETLAEDGNPSALVTAAGLLATTDTVNQTGSPAGPGATHEFTVTPTAAHPNLSIASMVGESNDLFIAFPPAGVALFGRTAAEVETDMNRVLAIWDAGTERNQAIGAGSTQAPRQGAGNTGAADPDNTVRRYGDAANDLADLVRSGFLAVTAEVNGDQVTITLENNSDSASAPYEADLSSLISILHDGTTSLFTVGSAASAELQKLAEDGAADDLATLVSGTIEGGLSTVDGTLSFTVTTTETNHFLNFAAMIMPSNDTFIALGGTGIDLFNGRGELLTPNQIEAAIETALRAYDAGTEANQAGGAGPDQPPRQAAANTGAAEGNGLVRLLDDPIWLYPDVADLVRVTITPVTN